MPISIYGYRLYINLVMILKRKCEGKLLKKCARCGKVMHLFPSQRTKKYCSKDCYRKYEGIRLKNCAACGKAMYLFPYEIDTRKFCSKECYTNYNKHAVSYCDWCGKEKSYKNKRFCSRECYIAWRIENLVGENSCNWKGGGVKKRCVICGKKYTCKQAHAKRSKCCSLRCVGVYTLTKKMSCKPTNPERIYERIAEDNQLPFEYTGNGKVIIGTKCPDFVATDGRKIVVEIFGRAFHSPLFTFRKEIKVHRTYKGTMAYYRRHKYKCIIFWDYDLLRDDVEEFVLSVLRKEGVI